MKERLFVAGAGMAGTEVRKHESVEVAGFHSRRNEGEKA